MVDGAQVTALLLAARAGDADAEERLITVFAHELKVMARRALAGERKNHTLQPTALVNELYLRFTQADTLDLHNRAHFLAYAATTMRRILVDHARAHRSDKRGGKY